MAGRIEKVLPKLDEMITEGLVTLTDVEIIKYCVNEKSCAKFL